MNARNAAAVTFAFGIALIVLAVGFYLGTGAKSLTALIPAGIGLPIAICGGLAFKENLRKHAVHAALVFALLGVIGMLMRLPKLLSGDAKATVVAATLLMGGICIIFIVLGIKSFRNARRERAAASANEV